MGVVLVVDDDVSIVKLVSIVLKSEGIAVQTAYNGAEGLGFLASKPDLILLDLSMPVMDGREFHRQARLSGYTGPVLICSAYGAESAKRELGAQDALDKPFDPDVLVAKVRAQLEPLIGSHT